MSYGRDQMEVERSRAAVLRMVTVSAISEDGQRASVIIDGSESAPIPWVVLNAGRDRAWWAPSEGQQVMIFSPDGLPESAVILGGVWCDRYPAPRSDPNVQATVWRDTSVQEYNSTTGRYILDILPTGQLVLTAPVMQLRADTISMIPYAREFAETDMRGEDKRTSDEERLQ